jgi:hypothetical protein
VLSPLLLNTFTKGNGLKAANPVLKKKSQGVQAYPALQGCHACRAASFVQKYSIQGTGETQQNQVSLHMKSGSSLTCFLGMQRFAGQRRSLKNNPRNRRKATKAVLALHEEETQAYPAF